MVDLFSKQVSQQEKTEFVIPPVMQLILNSSSGMVEEQPEMDPYSDLNRIESDAGNGG